MPNYVVSFLTIEKIALLILEDALSVWTNLGKQLLFVWLFVSSIKTGTRGIVCLDEVFFHCASLKTSNERLFIQTDNASCAHLYTRDK